MPTRAIRLRRPATLSIQDGVFVPQADQRLMHEIESRWEALCDSNPSYFDGRLYHVLGVHRNGHGGATLHVIDCAYRFFAVQTDAFDLGVRGLGVKGITVRDELILMGRRSQRVAAYRNLWEFAPAGSVEPGRQPAEVIRAELQEETGLNCLHEPIPRAVLFDPVLRCWEIVFKMNAGAGDMTERTGEYSQVEWRRADDLPPEHELSPVARQIAVLL